MPIIRRLMTMLYGVPWLGPRDPARPLEAMAYREIVEHARAIPPGVQARHGTGLQIPTQIPDLIGVQERRYLDHTGLVRHRGIADLMRYAALNQTVDLYSRHRDFMPIAQDARTLPEPTTASPFPFANGRYSDEQLYALAQFVYSLKPPANPNTRIGRVGRGKGVFAREGCATCHTPPLYTNNRLTPALGFTATAGDAQRLDLMPRSIGTDPGSRAENSSRHRAITRCRRSRACGIAVHSSTAARWRRSKTGSTRAGCAMITCRPGSRATV